MRAANGASDSVEGAGAWSLCWQAAVGRNFFLSRSLSNKIRNRLIDAHRKAGRILLDFIILPTEIHAIAIIEPGDSVGSLARGIGNVIARWTREIHPARGPVLAGPYWALRLDNEDALKHELRMLAWRPVVQRLNVSPSHHAQGALRVALGLSPSQGFNARPLLLYFGASVPAARKELRRWIARRPSEHEWRVWELKRGLEPSASAPASSPYLAKPIKASAAALIAAGRAAGVDGALTLLEAWVSAKLHAAGPLHLQRGHSANAARGRALVACLAVTHRLCSAAAVARHFGRAKSTLCEQMSACRVRGTDRALLATPVERILEEVALLMGDSPSVNRPGDRSSGAG